MRIRDTAQIYQHHKSQQLYIFNEIQKMLKTFRCQYGLKMGRHRQGRSARISGWTHFSSSGSKRENLLCILVSRLERTIRHRDVTVFFSSNLHFIVFYPKIAYTDCVSVCSAFGLKCRTTRKNGYNI
jgi:hypothetical protein